jgi:hypothetical protein
MTPHSPQPRWSREQIRAARLAPLVPLLQKRALHLVEQAAGNYLLPAYPGLIVKDSYDASAGKTGEPTANIGIQPTWSQRYDQSAVLWVQNAMAARNKSLNPYVGRSGRNTIGIKSVHVNLWDPLTHHPSH